MTKQVAPRQVVLQFSLQTLVLAHWFNYQCKQAFFDPLGDAPTWDIWVKGIEDRIKQLERDRD